jgi:hypothetical protein
LDATPPTGSVSPIADPATHSPRQLESSVTEVGIQQLLDEGSEAALTKTSSPMSTRGIKRDYRALHHGTPRVGGERAYSVRDTILHALKSAKADLKEPTSYTEALQSKQYEEWQQAINVELLSIQQNEVWHEVKEPPSDIKPLTTK